MCSCSVQEGNAKECDYVKPDGVGITRLYEIRRIDSIRLRKSERIPLCNVSENLADSTA